MKWKILFSTLTVTIHIIAYTQSVSLVPPTFSSISNGELIWHHESEYVLCSDPVMGQDGNILFVGHNFAGALNSTIYCYNGSGVELWNKQLPDDFEAQPLIMPLSGEIIIGGKLEGLLYCLKPDGTTKWIYDGGQSITKAAGIDTAGNIFFPVDNKLISLTPQGNFRWAYESQSGKITSAISINQYGNIYFGTEFNKLVALQPFGTEIFSVELFGHVKAEPSIKTDGIIYMTTCNYDLHQSKLQTFAVDGKLLWEMTFSEPNPSSAIIGDSNNIYIQTIDFFGGGKGGLYKIDVLSHSVEWSFDYDNTEGTASTPSISANGTCYFATAGAEVGRFYAINNDGTVKWEYTPFSNTFNYCPMGSILIGNNGILYTWGTQANSDGGLCFLAINDSGEQLADSPWPMLRHDKNHTGLAQNQIQPQPNIYYHPTALDFGFVEPVNSSTDTIRIKNTGTTNLSINWNLESEVFTISDVFNKKQMTDSIIEPNDSLVMVIRFSPVENKLYHDTLLFITNDSDQPIVYFSLKGKDSKEGNLKWVTHLPDVVTNSPAIDDFGTIYISGRRKIFALKKGGQIKWEYNIPTIYQNYADNITISSDNKFIYSPNKDCIISLDSSGIFKWNYQLIGNQWFTPLALSTSGSIYFGELSWFAGGHLYSLSPQGSLVWKYETGMDHQYEPVVDKNGNISISSNGLGGKIFSIQPSGIKNWDLIFPTTNALSVGLDNEILSGGAIFAFGDEFPCARKYTQNGDLVWSAYTLRELEEITTRIVTGEDGNMYFGTSEISTENGAIYCLNNEGEIQWNKQFELSVRSTPAIGVNGTIYFGCTNGNFYALNPDGTERWIIKTGAPINQSPAIDATGIVYFINENNDLYAVYGANGGLAHSSWPMIQHDTKHSSNAGFYTANSPVLEQSVILLYPNLPNPVTYQTVFSYYLPKASRVDCHIFDVYGNFIYAWGSEFQCSGKHDLIWAKQDNNGHVVKPGIYFFQLRSEGKQITQKIIVF